MADYSERLYNIARGYLDTMRGRLADIDARAQEELDRALTRGEAALPPPSSSDPMTRAANKINAARQAASEALNHFSEPLLENNMTYTPPPAKPGEQAPPAERTPRTYAAPMTDAQAYTPPLVTTSPPMADPIVKAYQVVGLPYGADYPTVAAAVQKLRDRCAPSRFPAGSAEQQEAEHIMQRIDEADRVLRTTLEGSDSRFDKLEF